MSVATFDAGVNRRGQRYGCAITIEGLGGASEGLWYLCDRAPSWAAGNAAWREVLDRPRPSILPERVSPFGGISEAGEIEFHVVDVADFLTAELGFDRDADAFLVAALNGSATTIELDRDVGVGDRLYAASEVFLVTAAPGSSTFTVTRAALGTDAQTHAEGDAVRTLLPNLRSRRARLYVYPLDGINSGTLREVGTFHLDDLELDEAMNVYTIRGKSQLKHLARQVARTQIRGSLDGWDAVQSSAIFGFDVLGGPRFWWDAGPGELASGDAVTLLVEDEVMGIRPITPSGSSVLQGSPVRGLLGTRAATHAVGADVTQIYAANRDFRVSPGPSPSSSRTSGTWVPAAHFVDLILILATSSAADEDGLELVNVLGAGRDDELANWSSLPVGVGVGTPIALIDVKAALDVKQRTQDVEFHHFYCGDEAVSFGELVTERFLRPIGAFIATSGGRATIKLPRAPVGGVTSFEIGPAQILRKKIGKRRYLPRVKVSQDMSLLVGAVRCKGMRTADGAAVEHTFFDDDFGATYGQRGFYGAAEGSIEFDARGVRAGPGGAVPFLSRAAESSLFRLRRPPLKLDLDVDDTLYALQISDLASFTLEEVPDFARAARGVTSMPIEVLTIEPVLDDKSEGGSFLTLLALAYMPGVRVGRISAAGRASGDSTDDGTNTTLVIEANHYTAPDAGNGLPTSDAAAFVVGDVITAISNAGVPTGALRTVISIGADTLVISGTGVVPDLTTVIYAQRPDQVAQQYAEYVSFGDRSGVIAGTSQSLWHYGEV